MTDQARRAPPRHVLEAASGPGPERSDSGDLPKVAAAVKELRRSVVRRLRSANSIDAAAMAARPPLVNHGGHGGDRPPVIFRRQRCSPRLPYHRDRCVRRFAPDMARTTTARQAATSPVPPESSHADSPPELRIDIEPYSSTPATMKLI
ncbi:hypothetical protein Asp14428_33930 [Actinoplanes sp. NBRC 14428]|nr:hypothetical protein Asp14428_33930 [Actinoplanes sp. NBRC 14428]